MTTAHTSPEEEERQALSARAPAETAPPPPPARRPRPRRILGYAGRAVLALVGTLVLLSIVGGLFEGAFSSGGAPGDPAAAGVIDDEPFWSPDSRLVAFDRAAYGSTDDESSGPSDVFVASADGRELRRLTRTPSDERVLGWLSSPARIVYAMYRPNEPTNLFALDPAGGAPVELGAVPKKDQLLALSHDARRALVGTPRFTPRSYALVDFTRKTRRPLPGRSGDWMWMDGAWSGDDSLLAYVTDEDIVVLRGERVLRRVPLGRYDSASGGLAWSPEGRLLAYGTGGDTSSLWLVRIADGSRSRLTGGAETSDLNPVWSPDGSRIYYEHGSFDDGDGLRVIAPDGSGDRKITSDDWAGGGLFNFEGEDDRWLDTATISPDGTRIAYLLGQRGAWKNWSLVGVMNADGTGKTAFPESP